MGRAFPTGAPSNLGTFATGRPFPTARFPGGIFNRQFARLSRRHTANARTTIMRVYYAGYRDLT